MHALTSSKDQLGLVTIMMIIIVILIMMIILFMIRTMPLFKEASMNGLIRA